MISFILWALFLRVLVLCMAEDDKQAAFFEPVIQAFCDGAGIPLDQPAAPESA